MPLILVRVGVATAVLLPILFLKEGRAGFQELGKRWQPLSFVGITNSALPFCLFAFSTLSVTAGFASLLNATAPLWAAVVARLWIGDRLPLDRVVGLAIGFAGVGLLVDLSNLFKPGGDGLAVLAALTATFSYGIAANYTKLRLTGVPPLVTATGSMLSSTLVLVIPALLLWPAHGPSITAWGSALALGVACTGVAYVIFFRLINRLGPARAITVTFLIPVFGNLWGALVLHEAISGRVLIGGSVILLGIALATGFITLPRGKKPQTS